MNDLTATEGSTRLEHDLLRVLRAATSTATLDYDAPPTRLTGGFWAELVAFRLAGAPVGWQGHLVARVMPDAVTAAKETIIQSEVAAQGFTTPAVHLAGGPEDGLGRAFMVMDRAEGGPLLPGLSGVGALGRLPRLAQRLPVVLAEAMARLHRLDVEPVRHRLRAVDGPATTLPAFLAGLEVSAASVDRSDLVTAARWLAAHPPASAPEVVCHGDLHPFNVLVDDGGAVTVLDWSAAILAPAPYDVAFTTLLLAEPPLYVPRPVRPVVRAAGRLVARRFLRGYERSSGAPLDMASVRWHQGVVSLRALVEVATWVAADEIEARGGHPWLVAGPAFATRLSTLTGGTVRPR